jgi:uncharacterized protein (DUF983 family)
MGGVMGDPVLQNIMNLECPDCGEDFGIGVVEQLSMDMVNGIVGKCGGCNKEYLLDVYIKVTEL